MWNRLNMKTKLIIFFIGIAAIPLVLTTLISSYLTHEALIRSVFDDAKVVASSVSREVDGVLNEKVRTLKVIANTADIQAGLFLPTSRWMRLCLASVRFKIQGLA